MRRGGKALVIKVKGNQEAKERIKSLRVSSEKMEAVSEKRGKKG